MIGYAQGATVRALINAGAVTALYGTSDTPEHQGDLVSVYFFDADGTEIAHQTQLAGQLGNPDVTFYRRSWGGQIHNRGYERARRWNALLDSAADIVENDVYRVI